MPGMGGHLMRKSLRGAKDGSQSSVPDKTFDFSAGLEAFAEFDPKKSVEDAGKATPEVVQKYDKKKSFFDSISCDALDKQKKMNGGMVGRTSYRTRVAEENRTNMETFGAISVNSNSRFRGNSRNNGPQMGGMRGSNMGGRRYDNRNNMNRSRNNNGFTNQPRRNRADASRNWRKRA